MATKKESTNKRPIDKAVESNYKGLMSRLSLVSNTQIKLWKVFIIVAFVGGFVAALAWAISLSFRETIDVDIRQSRAQQSQIENTATVTYEDSAGHKYTGLSNTLVIPIALGTNNLTIRILLEGREYANNYSAPVTVEFYKEGSNTNDLTLTGSINASGIFTGNTGSLSGRYDIKIIPQYYLAKKVLGAQIPSTSTIDAGTLLAGNLAADNTVNTSDFAIMSAAWFTSNNVADITKDGTVNTTDFYYLSNNWFKVGD